MNGKARSRYAVIIGCGGLGRHLAELMSTEGGSVVVIDRDPGTFAGLSDSFSGFTLEGDATQLSILNRAKTRQADVLFAVTENDNVNLMAAQVAKRYFLVPHVMARVSSPALASLFEASGIIPVSAVEVVAESLLRAIGSNGTKGT